MTGTFPGQEMGSNLIARASVWRIFWTRLLVEVALSRLRRSSIRRPSERTLDVKRWRLRWTLRLGDNLQRRLFLAHSYEGAVLYQVARRMRRDDVLVDVGANIGTFVLPLARHVASRARAFAVEAAPDTADLLERHVRVNGLSSRVTVVRAAFSDEEGIATLSEPRSARGDTGRRSLVLPGSPVARLSLRRGDDVLRELDVRRIDVLKVDVEGAELKVLTGLTASIQSFKPRLIVIELVRSHHAEDHVEGIVSFLEGFNYRGWWIRDRGLQRLTHPIGRDGNALFVMEST